MHATLAHDQSWVTLDLLLWLSIHFTSMHKKWHPCVTNIYATLQIFRKYMLDVDLSFYGSPATERQHSLMMSAWCLWGPPRASPVHRTGGDLGHMMEAQIITSTTWSAANKISPSKMSGPSIQQSTSFGWVPNPGTQYLRGLFVPSLYQLGWIKTWAPPSIPEHWRSSKACPSFSVWNCILLLIFFIFNILSSSRLKPRISNYHCISSQHYPDNGNCKNAI